MGFNFAAMYALGLFNSQPSRIMDGISSEEEYKNRPRKFVAYRFKNIEKATKVLQKAWNEVHGKNNFDSLTDAGNVSYSKGYTNKRIEVYRFEKDVVVVIYLLSDRGTVFYVDNWLVAYYIEKQLGFFNSTKLKGEKSEE